MNKITFDKFMPWRGFVKVGGRGRMREDGVWEKAGDA